MSSGYCPIAPERPKLSLSLTLNLNLNLTLRKVERVVSRGSGNPAALLVVGKRQRVSLLRGWG